MHGFRGITFGREDALRAALAGCLFLIAALLTTLPAHSAETLKGVALVIGNGDYEHLSKLPNPQRDAGSVEELLDKLGFDTTSTSDRDARRLRRDLEGFAEDAEGADVAVLYYSGHGIEAGGRNFLVPVDADLSSLDNAGESLVPVDALIAKLKEEVPIVIVMLDACRDNPFPADAVLKLTPGGEAQSIAVTGLGASRSAVAMEPTVGQSRPADANLGTVLAFAAEPGKVALDGEAGGNSPYAAALLRHLSAMAGDEFGLVMRMVAEEVYLKTKGQQRPWVNESMRRLLYLGQSPDQPTGAEGDILAERRGLLVTIASLPSRERQTIETVATDTGVPMDALYGMLSALGSEVPSDPKALDALLRGQTEKVKAMIAERDTLKSSDPEIQRLSGLADEALAEGALNTAISLRQRAKERALEVESTVEDAEAQVKERRLELAEVFAKSAEAYALAFKHREAARDYEEAARQVERWDEEQTFWYTRSAATAWLEAGKLRGGTPDLELAVEAGKRAATIAERIREDNPNKSGTWRDYSAQTLNNLANASNALFAASKRRSALMESINAYERALKVLSKDRVSLEWVIVQQNLAGSFMMLGEADEDTEMLKRSIAAYKEALTVWTRDWDPEKWALATGNLASTQAQLGRQTNDKGLVEESIANLKSALEVQTKETTPLDWAWSQRELADSYAELARITHNDEHLRMSAAATQKALEVYTVERMPRVWAQTMHDLAFAYVDSSTKENQRAVMEKAAAIYQEIIAVVSPEEQPGEYALAITNLGTDRIDMGRSDKDEKKVLSGIELVERGIAVFEKQNRPLDVARTTLEVARATVTLGNLRSSQVEPEQALAIYEKAALAYDKAGNEKLAAAARSSKAYGWVEIGYQRSKSGDQAGAVDAYRASLEMRNREIHPDDWLFSANQVAIALHNKGIPEQGVETLRDAAEAYRFARSATSAEKNPTGWSETQYNLAAALRTIAERTTERDDYVALSDAYGAIRLEKDRARNRDGRTRVAVDEAWALASAGEKAGDGELLKRASELYAEALKATDLSDADRLFHTLFRIRTLFFLGNYGGGDPARREAIAAIDANWALIEKAGSAAEKVNALVDRANLMQLVAANDPGAFSPEQMDEAFRRPVAMADREKTPDLWRQAQRFLVMYQLSDMENAAFPPEKMQTGISSLHALVDATPRQTEPTAWAELANWYGYALSLRGKRSGAVASFEEALPILRDALTTYEQANDASSIAHVRDSLCGTLVGLGRLRKQSDLVAEGLDHCDLAVTFMRDNKLAEVLPIAEANQADARKALAELGAARP